MLSHDTLRKALAEVEAPTGAEAAK
jgi:hypothetical protein